MANSTEYTAQNILPLALEEKSMEVVSTLLRKPNLLNIFSIFNNAKSSDIFGVGNPGSKDNTILMGLENDSLRVQMSDQTSNYEPLIKSKIQNNYKAATWRDTVAQESVMGTAPTFTVAVDANGTVTSITPSGGSGFTGSSPNPHALARSRKLGSWRRTHRGHVWRNC